MKTTAERLNHPCLECAKCVKYRHYKPDNCDVCVRWLTEIKNNGVNKNKCSEQWLMWNRSLVLQWKQNKVIKYKDREVDLIIWADEEKFEQWKLVLPIPKIQTNLSVSTDRTVSGLPLNTDMAGDTLASNSPPREDVPEPPSNFMQTSTPVTIPTQPAMHQMGHLPPADWSGFTGPLDKPISHQFTPEHLRVDEPMPGRSHKSTRSPSPPPSEADEEEEEGGEIQDTEESSAFTSAQMKTIKNIQSILTELLPQLPTGSHTEDHGFSLEPETSTEDHRFSPEPGTSTAVQTQHYDIKPEVVTHSNSEDDDLTSPPIGRSKTDPIHMTAGDILDQMWHDIPAQIVPIPMPGIHGHTESTIYYCGSKIQYKWHENIPQLLLMEENKCRNLPVDQEYVKVFKVGGHMAFSIAEPEAQLHSIFWPFIFYALKQSPLEKSPNVSKKHEHLRNMANMDLIKKNTSFTPMDSSKEEWEERDKDFAERINSVIEKVAFSPAYNYKITATPLPVISSATGMSQYLQGPMLQIRSTVPKHKDLFKLLRVNVNETMLADEHRARTAAFHLWSLVHPLQFSKDLLSIVDSTVFESKREGIKSLPLNILVQGIYDATSLTQEHLENMFYRSLAKAVQIKMNIRKRVLGYVTPHCIWQTLLCSSLVHPQLFAPEALTKAAYRLERVMPRDYAGRVLLKSASR